MEEVWKDIVGYEGIYQVSNIGRIKSLERIIYRGSTKLTKKESIMNLTRTSTGYLQVNLCFNKKRKKYLVHRLVAKAFIPNPNRFPQINHIDENKYNNSAANLEWCNNVYNNNYGSHKKHISDAMSKAIYCEELDKVFKSQSEAAKEFGVSTTAIWYSCNNPKRKAAGYHWRYAD